MSAINYFRNRKFQGQFCGSTEDGEKFGKSTFDLWGQDAPWFERESFQHDRWRLRFSTKPSPSSRFLAPRVSAACAAASPRQDSAAFTADSEAEEALDRRVSPLGHPENREVPSSLIWRGGPPVHSFILAQLGTQCA